MVVCLLVALPGVANAATSTTITIKSQQGGFFGYVKSGKQTCEAGRKVSLYKQRGSRRDRSRDQRIGTDTAQPNGPDSMWSIGTNGQGRFYAYVRATSKCAGAYTRAIRAEPAT